jgi:DNA-binding response OmpR family regulator
MRILLAEDDLLLGKLIKHMLESEHHQVDWATRGDEALSLATDFVYDVIILDWMLPGLEGLTLCRQLRTQEYQKPILMLTAKDAVSDRVAGLDAGADDYLVKPFEFSELFARLRALSRRGEAPLQEEVIHFGDLVLNRTTRIVKRNHDHIQLTTREFQLLDLLAQNCGHVLPREVILDRIWGLGSNVSDNNLDAHIRLLRKKIARPDGQIIIRTIRGVGYKVEC